MLRNILGLVLLSAFLMPCFGQEFVTTKNKDFEWRVIGRALFDGGVFFSDSTDLGNAVKISDLRLGVVTRFLEHWTGKIELGYSESKIGIKDVFIDYAGGNHSVRVGHFFEPFAIDPLVGTTDYRMLTMGATARAFGDRRKLGVSYTYNQKYLTASGGFFSDGDVDNMKSLDEGYTLAGKFVGRPVNEAGKVVHLGVSTRFSEHDKDERKNITFTSGAPTDLLTKDQNAFLKADVTNMVNMWKFGAEAIVLYNKWYFQSEYLMAHVNRFGAKNYTGAGWYAQASYLVLGKQHNYSQANGWVSNPAPGSLEVLCRYNITDMNDRKAGIMGGQEQDVTLGANYMFNKYVMVKLNYSRVMMDRYTYDGGEDFDIIQARVQFWF